MEVISEASKETTCHKQLERKEGAKIRQETSTEQMKLKLSERREWLKMFS